MEGRNLGQIRQRYKDIFPTALLANWKVWPLAQVSQICILFGFLSSDHPFLVDQLPIHAASIPRSIYTDLRSLLDVVPLPSEFRVRTKVILPRMLFTLS